jgi:hypothetical protein
LTLTIIGIIIFYLGIFVAFFTRNLLEFLSIGNSSGIGLLIGFVGFLLFTFGIGIFSKTTSKPLEQKADNWKSRYHNWYIAYHNFVFYIEVFGFCFFVFYILYSLGTNAVAINYLLPISAVTILLGSVLGYNVLERIETKKADERETKAEDDILLQATAFSQAALWIYLNLITSNWMVDIMKVLVPSLAILFYAFRGYAKLKDSNRWRYRSMFLLAAVVGISLNVVGISLNIMAFSKTVNLWVLAFFSVFAFVYPWFVVLLARAKLKKRYGL